MPGQHAYITQSSVCLPGAPVDNDAIETWLGQIGQRPSRARRIILRNNGIRQRHYAIDPETGLATMSNAQMTAAAVRGLAGSHFALNDIECLATGTSLPDQLMPNHGVMVHGELAIPPCEVISTSGICTSGVAALKYAWLSVVSGQTRNAVSTGSDRWTVKIRSPLSSARADCTEISGRPDAVSSSRMVASPTAFPALDPSRRKKLSAASSVRSPRTGTLT